MHARQLPAASRKARPQPLRLRRRLLGGTWRMSQRPRGWTARRKTIAWRERLPWLQLLSQPATLCRQLLSAPRWDISAFKTHTQFDIFTRLIVRASLQLKSTLKQSMAARQSGSHCHSCKQLFSPMKKLKGRCACLSMFQVCQAFCTGILECYVETFSAVLRFTALIQ